MATEVPTDCKVSDLLDHLELPSRGTAIAVDNKVIGKPNWESTVLLTDAKVTIIKATQGG